MEGLIGGASICEHRRERSKCKDCKKKAWDGAVKLNVELLCMIIC